MKVYETNTPRAVLGFIAVAISATTIAALVIVPAKLDAATAAGYPVSAALTCITTTIREKRS